MLRTIRAIRLFNHIVLGLVLLVLTGALWNNGNRLLKITKQWWLGRTTRLLNMNIEVEGEFPAKSDTGLLLVSNHVSWTDIPVIGSLVQLNFLSKAEVKNWPLIGKLAHNAGTLFIQRGAGDATGVAKQIADYLGAGRSVLFFPEGTTSDGRSVNRFHRKLFRACDHIDAEVVPLAIRYEVEGLDHNPVAFVGDDEFTHHLWQLLAFSRVDVKVTVLAPRRIAMAQLDQQVDAIRNDILTAITRSNNCPPVNTPVNTSVQLPGASSRGDQPDEAASF